MKKTLIIIIKAQFGYHIDTFKYCQYLKDDFEITYFCFDHGLKKKQIEGINVVYVTRLNRGFLKRVFRFFYEMHTLNKDKKWDIVFIKNFDYCFLVKFLIRSKQYNLDLRTGSVSLSFFKRKWVDFKTKINVLFYNKFSVISKGLAKKFNIKDFVLLPLGADEISNKTKYFSSIKLLYVGTLDNRNIEETIIGVKLFVDNTNEFQIKYDIFGMGSKNDIKKITNAINDNGLDDIVKYHGRKSHDELADYFDNCNVGISYIPMTSYYDYQPPTKTFEYIFSGMVCIATRTKANAKLINESNGVICEDNSESFAKGIETITHLKESYNSIIIKNSLKTYSWVNICKNTLKPYLENLS